MAKAQHSSGLLDTTTLEALEQPRLALVYTEWNDAIVQELMKGCNRVAQQHNTTITHSIAVPGAFELPFACKQIWDSSKGNPSNAPEAIIAFGTVIRGGTPHFEYVCKAVTEGILQLNLILPIPVIFGVLTMDTEEQAWERLGGSHGHKGEEAAITALKIIRNSRGLKL